MPDDAAAYIGQLSPDRRWRWDGTAWTATDAAPALTPAWARLRLRAPATLTAVVSVVFIGLMADQALRVGAIGLGASIALVAESGLLVLVGRMARLQSRLLAAGAALFAAWLSLRASPWLLVPDIAASLLLM